MASPIILFTDFGVADLYVGQLKGVFNHLAPQVSVIDLLHEAPAFNPTAAAHLLAALAPRFPEGSVFLAVVDPGVGSQRQPLAIQADRRWYVGPDNGLLSVVAARARHASWQRIAWQPERLATAFHGRDLFAPVAAALARGNLDPGWLEPLSAPAVAFGAGDLDEVIYVDHYGNAMTGMRAGHVSPASSLAIGAKKIPHARIFSEVASGAPLWHENSLGLIEIAVNCGSAAQRFNLAPGSRVKVINQLASSHKNPGRYHD
jgi:hypothetical protein